MRRFLGYGLLGLVAYGFFMLLQLPASTLVNWVSQSLPGISIQHAQGSAVHGIAHDVRLSPLQNVQLESLRWRLRFLPLLIGQVEYRVTASRGDVQLRGVVGTGLSRDWHMSGIEGEIPLSQALSAAGQSPPLFDGELSLDGVGIALTSDGVLQDAQGDILLSNLRTAFGEPLQLGSFSGELTAEDANLIAALKDRGGPLNFAGTLSLSVAPEGRYRLQGRVSLRENADSRLRNALGLLGDPGEDGAWALDFTGILNL